MQAPPPDFNEMDEVDIQTYYASERERQVKHKAACERIERWRKIAAQHKREISVLWTDSVLSESETKLEQARRQLKLARQQEKSLRA